MKNFANTILKWFEQFGRHDLPWQIKPTPYRVWVSEIMLQQTQVSTVIDYYQKFMKRFPTVKALAIAGEDEVLSYWSGLGYYARARNLHKTAKIINQQYSGHFPKEVDNLIALPGIGRSTAGAILSLGMQLHAPILDGNVKRVLSRFHAIEEPLAQTAVINQLWDIAAKYTPHQNVHKYNQAMMDLGATICTRSKPNCTHCPVIKGCQAFALGLQQKLPIKSVNKTRPKKVIRMLILKNSANEILLEKRPPTGIWGGLWSFPECSIKETLSQWCKRHFDAEILTKKSLPAITHQFSHFELQIKPVLLMVNTHPSVMESSSQVWYKLTKRLPGGIPAPVSQLLALDKVRGTS